MLKFLSLFVGIFLIAANAYAGTFTAATCSRADVDAVINGPTHTAVNGDVIQIPSGSCTWTSGITVPSAVGITISGSGTPNSGGATTGASGSCSATTITATGSFIAFTFTPSYGNATSRLSCLGMTYSSGSAVGISSQGTCTSSGCPSIRWDNLTFTGWSARGSIGSNSYGVNAASNVFGVIDHNTLTGTGGYLPLVEIGLPSYKGVGDYGDNDWADGDNYGAVDFLFIENNLFDKSSTTENEGIGKGGGRVVSRFNTFSNIDTAVGFLNGWHGTESSGRPRSVHSFEIYNNTATCVAGQQCWEIAAPRNGTGLVWGNTYNYTGAFLNQFVTFGLYRVLQDTGSPWKACDGAGPYDNNDGTTYYSGTISSVSGSNPYTITVTGSPGWTTSQWVSAGSPYSMHDVTLNNGSEIAASGSNTLTVNAWTTVAYTAGDSIQILRATRCIDQVGWTGGQLYTSLTPSPVSAVNQTSSPARIWMNTLTGGAPIFGDAGGVVPGSARIIANREYYRENYSQSAQSSATSPFNGTTTIGMGHGTLANRPTTCTTGVAYWATDQGSWNSSGSGGQGRLYTCTSTDTWTLSYTPYTYPHPLAASSSSSGGSILKGRGRGRFQ